MKLLPSRAWRTPRHLSLSTTSQGHLLGPTRDIPPDYPFPAGHAPATGERRDEQRLSQSPTPRSPRAIAGARATRSKPVQRICATGSARTCGGSWTVRRQRSPSSRTAKWLSPRRRALGLATVGFNTTVSIWSVPDRTEVLRLTGHLWAVQAARFADDGTLYSCGSDGQIREWKVQPGWARRASSPPPLRSRIEARCEAIMVEMRA